MRRKFTFLLAIGLILPAATARSVQPYGPVKAEDRSSNEIMSEWWKAYTRCDKVSMNRLKAELGERQRRAGLEFKRFEAAGDMADAEAKYDAEKKMHFMELDMRTMESLDVPPPDICDYYAEAFPPVPPKAGEESPGGDARKTAAAPNREPPRAINQYGWMTGAFDSEWGEMQLIGGGGRYDRDGGWMTVERIDGAIVEGVWGQSDSGQECPDGRHWGRYRFTFAETGFTGIWSYCDEPLGGSWTGTRK